MNCDDVQTLLGSYIDMSLDDELKQYIDEHLVHCDHCLEYYGNMDEELFQMEYDNLESSYDPLATPSLDRMNDNVMKQIFQEESWLAPTTVKSYSFSKYFRRNLAIIVTVCMAILTSALFMMLFNQQPESLDIASMSGFMDPSLASADPAPISASFYAEVPVASISDPIILTLVPTFPQYYIALSLIGIVMALLSLNWISRTRN
ncbi:anti-sigma factor family protein [Paenibacillus yanchengensis]|uniref:Anti-sigma factor family protein n=1 Tax=Paenibacillus yanchengensis TaxID=2035833 RepID=A0ABW4YJW6_9BACL